MTTVSQLEELLARVQRNRTLPRGRFANTPPLPQDPVSVQAPVDAQDPVDLTGAIASVEPRAIDSKTNATRPGSPMEIAARGATENLSSTSEVPVSPDTKPSDRSSSAPVSAPAEADPIEDSSPDILGEGMFGDTLEIELDANLGSEDAPQIAESPAAARSVLEQAVAERAGVEQAYADQPVAESSPSEPAKFEPEPLQASSPVAQVKRAAPAPETFGQLMARTLALRPKPSSSS
ncbi:MAG: hypothetical protein AAF355_05795 [Myxococcota bacterium]